MKIIIVGAGKAAYLHSLKYKMMNIEEVIFLDKKNNSKYVDSSIIYLSLDELMNKESINPKDTIVDICTPCSTFISIIDEFISKKFDRFIVEKPFVVPSNYFDDKKDISFIMMENYKKSLVTEDMINYIKSNKLNIKKIYINFSKDRIKESFSKRGMSDKEVPTNFEIEMPHEIYLADYFLQDGIKNYKRVILKDMIYNNDCLKKHGYGLIEYEQNGVDVVLESNLMDEKSIRTIIIECDNNIELNGSFILYGKSFDKKENGFFSINKKIIKEYETDDNVYYSLNKYVKELNKNNNNELYKKEIIDFSNTMRYVIENAIVE